MEKKIKAPIVEIFRSLEGEGLWIGTPTIFVRTAGCNVGCIHCDSKQTWSASGYKRMTAAEVAARIVSLASASGVKRISITGGEPLLCDIFVYELCLEIRYRLNNMSINIETSGTIFPFIFTTQSKSLKINSWSMDIKTPSSGVVLDEGQIQQLKIASKRKDVFFKAVINSKKDLEFVIHNGFHNSFNPLVLTPCEIDSEFFSVEKILLYLKESGIAQSNIRIIAQQHKILGYR